MQNIKEMPNYEHMKSIYTLQISRAIHQKM